MSNVRRLLVADFDQDGYVDIFAARFTLFINDGDGTFSFRTE